MTTLRTPGLKERDPSQQLTRSIKVIEQHLQFYSDEIEMHPVGRLLAEGKVSTAALRDCAAVLFRSSVLWVPLLSLLKDRAKNPRLKKALLENLLCESGATGTSHVELCSRLLRSVEANTSLESTDCQPIELPNASLDDLVFVAELDEPELVGWLLAAESLTPVTHKLLLEGFRQLEEADSSFLEEHIVVDSEEHSVWMKEAAAELLEQNNNVDRILAGIQIGARAELALLDSIYAKHLRTKPILVARTVST